MARPYNDLRLLQDTKTLTRKAEPPRPGLHPPSRPSASERPHLPQKGGPSGQDRGRESLRDTGPPIPPHTHWFGASGPLPRTHKQKCGRLQTPQTGHLLLPAQEVALPGRVRQGRPGGGAWAFKGPPQLRLFLLGRIWRQLQVLRLSALRNPLLGAS